MLYLMLSISLWFLINVTGSLTGSVIHLDSFYCQYTILIPILLQTGLLYPPPSLSSCKVKINITQSILSKADETVISLYNELGD